MPVDFTFRPLTTWPGPATANRRRALFSASHSRTLDELDREVWLLGGRRAVVELDCDASQIRRDGLPRSDARIIGPGVVLSFESKHGPVRFPCDTYRDWRDNLRAIVLAMTALRAVDRYGVTQRGEQYRGWTALPASTEAPMSHEEAARVIITEAGEAWYGDDYEGAVSLVAEGAQRAEAIRWALKATHPDTGGNAEAFHRVQRARKALNV